MRYRVLGDHMTNKTKKGLNTYGGKDRVVNHLAMRHNDCLVLNVDLIRDDEYGKSNTYFAHFWTKVN